MSAVHGEAWEELLAAAALHALPASEEALVNAHVGTCTSCTATMADFEAVAAALGNSGGDAPTEVWDRIAGQLGNRNRRGWPVLVGVVAAALVAVALLIIPSTPGKLTRVLSTRSARHLTLLASADPEVNAGFVVVTPGGTGVVTGTDLANLTARSTYQLWGAKSGHLVSMGLMGRDPTTFAFHADGPIRGYAITVEPERGTRQPTTRPVAATADFGT